MSISFTLHTPTHPAGGYLADDAHYQHGAQETASLFTTAMTVTRVVAGVLCLIATAASAIAFLASGNPIAAVGTIVFGVASLILLDKFSTTSLVGRTRDTYTSFINPHPAPVYTQLPMVRQTPVYPSSYSQPGDQRVQIGNHGPNLPRIPTQTPTIPTISIPQPSAHHSQSQPQYIPQVNLPRNQYNNGENRVQIGDQSTATEETQDPNARIQIKKKN